MAAAPEVMVLDDEPTVGERLKEYLEQHGMQVETFVDSQRAVARLGERSFDVVVTDLKMKAPTGIDVLLAVRERHPQTQVIVITGYRTIEDARSAECIGAFGFVDKPFRMEELLDLVRRAVKRARSGKG